MKLYNFRGEYIEDNKGPLDFFIKTLNGMAYGLFATLIIGTIIATLNQYIIKLDALEEVANIVKGLMGVGIGLGVAWSLKFDGLKLIVGAVSGGIAYSMAPYIGDNFTYAFLGESIALRADPLVIYITVVGTLLFMKTILPKKTPLDIILIPLVGIIWAFAISLVATIPISLGIKAIGTFIILATNITPFFMGMVIAVVMGMALTAPISSAAIAVSIQLGTNAVGFSQSELQILGIAGGAALTGCCVQMLGFAVMSRKDNNIGTILSVGIGTSMLQFKNILKKPIIWLPTIIVSAILGPLSTVLFKMKTTSIGAGMGTSGLVGQISTIDSMGVNSASILSISILQIVLPIVLVLVVDIIFRKFGLIKKGDLAI